MKKVYELLGSIRRDPILDNSDELLTSIMDNARCNESLKKLVLLTKNLPSVANIIKNYVSEWTKDIGNDCRIASLLIVLFDVNCVDQAIKLSSTLIRSTTLSRTKTIAASILLRELMYGNDCK